MGKLPPLAQRLRVGLYMWLFLTLLFCSARRSSVHAGSECQTIYSSQFLTEEKFASPAHFCPVHKGPSFAIITSDDLHGNNFSHPVHFYPPIFPSHWFRLFSAEEIINDTSCCTPVFTHSFRFGSCSQSLVVCCWQPHSAYSFSLAALMLILVLEAWSSCC